MVTRAAFETGKAVVVAINEPFMDLDYMVYQFKYDSVHGPWKGTVVKNGNDLVINGTTIKVFKEKEPEKIGWGASGADYICESTGKFLDQPSASKHLTAGAKKVIMSAPAKDKTPMFVMGVNESTYNSSMTIVSNASCTTNCLAPVQ